MRQQGVHGERLFLFLSLTALGQMYICTVDGKARGHVSCLTTGTTVHVGIVLLVFTGLLCFFVSSAWLFHPVAHIDLLSMSHPHTVTVWLLSFHNFSSVWTPDFHLGLCVPRRIACEVSKLKLTCVDPSCVIGVNYDFAGKDELPVEAHHAFHFHMMYCSLPCSPWAFTH